GFWSPKNSSATKMRSETMYVFLTTSRSFYIKGLIPECRRIGLNSAKNVQLRRAPMNTQTPAKSSLTGVKMTLVSQAFHQDQNRLHRSSGSPEIAIFPIRVPFPASFVSLLPGPPRLTDGPPHLPPEQRLAVGFPFAVTTRPTAVATVAGGRIFPAASSQ